jgi:predicted DNA-binding transcriptional regulator AlpA
MEFFSISISADSIRFKSLMQNALKQLPLSLPPRGLSRCEAAAYVGVSPSLFDQMVKDGRMPQPKRINNRTVWDRHRLDVAFEVLPDSNNQNPWDEVAV